MRRRRPASSTTVRLPFPVRGRRPRLLPVSRRRLHGTPYAAAAGAGNGRLVPVPAGSMVGGVARTDPGPSSGARGHAACGARRSRAVRGRLGPCRSDSRDGPPSPAPRAAALVALAGRRAPRSPPARAAADTSFDPATPCDPAAREQMKGAYPDLEARIPVLIDGEGGRQPRLRPLLLDGDARLGLRRRRDRGALRGRRSGRSASAAGSSSARSRATGSRRSCWPRSTAGPPTPRAGPRPSRRRRSRSTAGRRGGSTSSTATRARRSSCGARPTARSTQAVVAADVDEAQLQAAIAAYR